MTRPGHVARWRTAVLRDRGIGDAARVLALLLAEHADGNGYVGLPREQLTEMLGVDPSRITQRRAELVATGYLHLVRRHVPIETPVQDDPWATDAHHLRTAAPQTKDAATEDQQRNYAAREQDGRSPLALALARSPIQRGRA